MEAIKCPNCGSEKVQGLTEEKYVCLACDNVFLIHNLSKEFQQTDEHISNVHQDLKEGFDKLLKGNGINEAALLEKAEEHLRKENWQSAYECYFQLAEEFPQHSAGWYGKYRALTGNFTQVDRYARFVCDGNYIDLAEGEERVNFEGYTDIKCALNCEDADTELIKREVTQFIKRCAEYGKNDIENSIREAVAKFEENRKERDFRKDLAKKEKGKDQLKDLAPAFIVLALLGVCILYFFASGDWLGKVLGIVGMVLVLKFGWRKIINSIGKAKADNTEWNEALAEYAMPLVDEMDTQVEALLYYCVDLDNYNKILQEVQDEEKFIQYYVDNPLEGLHYYGDISVDKETFVFDFINGRIEKYKYLLSYDTPMPTPSMRTSTIQATSSDMLNSQTAMFCSACGTKISADSVFCYNCGQKLK